jgi:hypothetical protein
LFSQIASCATRLAGGSELEVCSSEKSHKSVVNRVQERVFFNGAQHMCEYVVRAYYECIQPCGQTANSNSNTDPIGATRTKRRLITALFPFTNSQLGNLQTQLLTVDVRRGIRVAVEMI